MGKHDCPKDGRCHCLHSVHVATSEQDIVIKRSVDNFNVNEDSFAFDFNGDILEETFGRGWSSVIISQSDGIWYELEGAKFLPCGFGHDACGCPFIDDASMDCDVLYFDGDLNSDCGGKMWFAVIEVKGDKSSICRIDCPHCGK